MPQFFYYVYKHANTTLKCTYLCFADVTKLQMTLNRIKIHQNYSSVGTASIKDRKAVDPRFDYRTGNALSCPLEKTLKTCLPLGTSSLSVLVSKHDQKLATEPKKDCSTLVEKDAEREHTQSA